MIGLIKTCFTAGEIIIEVGGIGEFPADGRFGSDAGPGHLDEGITRGRGDVARDNQIGCEITDPGRRGGVRGHVPAHFNQSRVFCGILGLVGALPLNVDNIARENIARGTGDGGGGDGLGQGDGDRAIGAGRARIGHGGDFCARPKIGFREHGVITNLRGRIGGAGQADVRLAQRGIGRDPATGADDNAISQPRITRQRGRRRIRAVVFWRQVVGRQARHRHRDLPVQVLLEQARGRHGITREHILAHDLGRHDGDERDGKQQQTGDSQGREDFNQREAAALRNPAAGNRGG